VFTSFNCTLAVAHRLRTVIDYDRLIVLDKGQVGVVHLVFGGHNWRLLSCTVDRLQNLIRPGISSIRLVVYSGICVFEAGPSMSWRPQRRQRQGQTIHDRRPDVYYLYIYLFLSHNIECLLVSHSAFGYYKNTALPRKCKICGHVQPTHGSSEDECH